MTFLHRTLLILALTTWLGAQPTRLELGKTVEADLAGGQTHQYVVAMSAGQFARIVVSLPGFETVVRLSEPAQEGAPLELHWPAGSLPEPLCWIARTAGDFRVELKPAGRAATGKYSITLQELRDTVADDAKQIEVQQLFEAARGLNRKKQYAEAIKEWELALAKIEGTNNREYELAALIGLGNVYSEIGQYPKAAGFHQRALTLSHETKDSIGQLLALLNLGFDYLNLGESEKANNYSIQALAISRESKSLRMEARALLNLGFGDQMSRRNEQASQNFERALSIFVELRDLSGEGGALYNLGNLYRRNPTQYEKAIDYYERALAIFRQVNNRREEGDALNALGTSYGTLGQYTKAIGYLEQARQIYQEMSDRVREGKVMNYLGNVYRSLSQFRKAITYYEVGLAIHREFKDRKAEGIAMESLGDIFLKLSQYEKAIEHFEQSLSISREFKDRSSEALALSGLGRCYWSLNQYDKAMNHFEQQLIISRELKDPRYESLVLGNLGRTYLRMNKYEKAISYFEEALVIETKTKTRQGESVSLAYLADAYRKLGQYRRAFSYSEQSLKIAREIKSREVETEVYSILLDLCKATGNPRLGVFYGKQAINTIQSIRGDIQGLSKDMQQSFINGNEKSFHTLAELLIAQGRLAEAEQVLGLLKEKEYFDYIRRDTAEAATLNRRVSLTAEESEWEKRYATVGDRLVTIGTERGELSAKKSLTPEETARLNQLEEDLKLGNQAFEKFLTELSTHFTAKSAGPQRIEDIRETQSIVEDLPTGTVALFTVMGEDKLSIILRTRDVQKAYAFPIKAADLNQKISYFRQVIQNPKLDPRPLAQEMYQILIGPMANDLRQAKAVTLMWSLDGALRYLPLAALYDGKQYLVEQYRMSVMTLASNSRLKDKPSAQWQAAGFGVTKSWQGSSALPAVAGELSGIITTKSGDGGVLAGEIQLDEKFTQVSMRDALRKGPTVVHIASHFQFQAGDQTNSFLLLGDGGRLSMDEVRTSTRLFDGVQLLTLSACNTGVGDGAEVEGFGVVAQRQGAKAVIASLWPVADASTSFLMREFYRIRESTPGITKAEAMGRAQIELLRGTAKPTAGGDERAFIQEAQTKKTAKVIAPSFRVNESAPYAHPYFWAPFFLMGNWL